MCWVRRINMYIEFFIVGRRGGIYYVFLFNGCDKFECGFRKIKGGYERSFIKK